MESILLITSTNQNYWQGVALQRSFACNWLMISTTTTEIEGKSLRQGFFGPKIFDYNFKLYKNISVL